MFRWLFLCYRSHALLVIHMLPLCHAPLLIQIDATTMSCSLGHLQLPLFHVTSLSIHMLHQWVFTCDINEYSHLTSIEYSHVTSMSFHMWHQWVFTCYINEYSHVTSMSIHMLHQWVFTCYIEYSHVAIKLCFFGYSYATWVMLHLSFSWYQWHTSLVIQMQQLCHAYSHAANMQSLLVSYMHCYCNNMI